MYVEYQGKTYNKDTTNFAATSHLPRNTEEHIYCGGHIIKLEQRLVLNIYTSKISRLRV